MIYCSLGSQQDIPPGVFVGRQGCYRGTLAGTGGANFNPLLKFFAATFPHHARAGDAGVPERKRAVLFFVPDGDKEKGLPPGDAGGG